ncbi:hypothetical protein NOR_01571 [Metarhizium rileyi]|uniref:Uncharacterized protein n=1 Tax=Metarhizium rileyi (strain RCEF 4871) TaxID=1649241 RepID=A0A162JVB0_METRR|nr:hypothetical protein NOR_01571 [Metarhizium rileyi RCEF 4871]
MKFFQVATVFVSVALASPYYANDAAGTDAKQGVETRDVVEDRAANLCEIPPECTTGVDSMAQAIAAGRLDAFMDAAKGFTGGLSSAACLEKLSACAGGQTASPSGATDTPPA